MSPVAALPVPPKPAPVPAWRRPATYAQLAMGGLFGGLGMLAVLAALDGPSGAEAMLMLVALFPAVWLHLIIHEAGHARAGWAGGQHVAAIGLGPWRFERGGDGWRFSKGTDVQGIGGFALVLPTRETVTVAERSAYLLGGPLANLLAATALAAAVPVFGIEGRVAAALNVVAVVGALIGVVNLVPFLSGGWSSDGRQLLALWCRWPESRVVESMSRWTALAMLGVRPRDWPEAPPVDEAGLPQALRDALQRMRLVIALDRNESDTPDAAAAARAIAEGFWTGPDGIRQINAALLASWELKRGAPPEAVDAWLAESEGGLLDQTATRAWLRAALALARDDRDVATAKLAEARAALPRVIDAASRAMLVEELEALEVRLAGKGPASPM
ncbi:MAG: hypothetical protein ACRC2H_04295 [Silanimonas sp.]